MTDKLKLKPCPFCGGPAEIVDNNSLFPNSYFVGCWWCGAWTNYEHRKEIAAELWNRRVDE